MRDPAVPHRVTPPDSLIRLRLLGAIDLRGPDGRELVAVLRQPKRLALLAFLVIGGGGRWHRRDDLLARFWPDLDTGHARAALRRATWFLRRQLGAGVIQSRAGDELGVAPDRLWCDAGAFREALATGRWEAALDLYRGDLMQGVFIAAAGDAERWLEEERAALRTAAAKAAAAQAVATEGWAGAELARRAITLAPFEEEFTRTVMRKLADLGDRAGALRAHDELVRRLRADLDLEPHGETTALASRIRAEERMARPAPRPGGGGAASSHLVLVGPIAVRGGERFAYLGPALVELLATTLHGAGPYRTVDPALATGTEAEQEGLAARVGASHQVTGTIIEAGGRLRAVVTLVGPRGEQLTRLEEDTEAEGGIFELADLLTRRLIAALGVSDRVPLVTSAVRMTRSLRAIRAWMTGEYAFRDGRVRDAVKALGEVVREDPDFALAHYRHGCALASAGRPADARRAMLAAIDRRSRLSDHDRRLVEAHQAWLGGDHADADLSVDTLVLTYPESVQGWFLLGDIRFHSNPDRGRSVTASRPAFERVLELDPDHTGALMHLARLDALEGRGQAAADRIDRLVALHPEADNVLAMHALRAFLIGDEADQDRIVQALAKASGLAMVNAFVDVAVTARNLAGAERLAGAMLSNARSDAFMAHCHVAIAHLRFAMGRPEEAMTGLEHLPSIRPGWAVAARTLLRTLPFLTTPGDTLRIDRAILLAASPPPTPAVLPPLLEIHDALAAHLRWFLLGLVDARLGDERGILTAIQHLAETPLPEGAEGLLEYMDRTLRAEYHRSRGEPREALVALGPPLRGPWYQTALFSPVFAGVHQRALRAMLLTELGRTEEARAWWRCMAERSPFELVSLAAPARWTHQSPLSPTP